MFAGEIATPSMMSAGLLCLRASPRLLSRLRTSPAALLPQPHTPSFLLVSKRPCFHGGGLHGGGAGLGKEALTKPGRAPMEPKKAVTGSDMLRAMVAYVWPKDNPEIRRRVQLALGLVVGAKLLNISVPFFFKHSVDYLNELTGGTLNFDGPVETTTSGRRASRIRSGTLSRAYSNDSRYPPSFRSSR